MANNYNDKSTNKIEYIAVLDLGSESMFAFLGKKDMTELKQIDLQDETNIKNWTGSDIDDIKVYKNSNGEKSMRLKNKIAIETSRGDVIKNKTNHAKTNYSGDYSDTIFQLFQKNIIYDYDYMCNPKVIYAKGAENILPIIKDRSGDIIELKPDEYLKHLTTQIANNLILKSKQVKNISPETIKLVITIPNIYSLTHAKELTEFLKRHTDFGEIGYIYESDAVLYASLTSDFNSFEKSTKEILSEKFNLIKNNINRNNKIYLISHDIGKGTTDLSLFTSFTDENNKENKHIWINSRTGLTKAGNALDYIFVRFFEKEVLEVFYKQNNIDNKEGFSFINKTNYKIIQNQINEHIQEVIFRIKKNIEKGFFKNTYKIPKHLYRDIKDFSTNTSTVKKKQNDAIDIVENLKSVCEKIIEGNISKGYIDNDNKDRLIRELYDLFIATSFKKGIFGILLPEKIGIKITNYVKEIGDTLPYLLKHNAKKRTEYINKEDVFEVSPNTFVVVSGQASQFKPLKETIISAYYSYFKVKEKNIIFLENKISKQICAVGGFLKEQTDGQHILQNRNELLADYYLINVGTGQKWLNYEELNNGDEITYDTDGQPSLYYYSILNKDDNEVMCLIRDKQINIDSFKAFIKNFGTNGTFKVKYNTSTKYFEINGYTIELGATVDNDESINQNIWPEILLK
jgi:hypothetical protein